MPDETPEPETAPMNEPEPAAPAAAEPLKPTPEEISELNKLHMRLSDFLDKFDPIPAEADTRAPAVPIPAPPVPVPEAAPAAAETPIVSGLEKDLRELIAGLHTRITRLEASVRPAAKDASTTIVFGPPAAK